MPRRPRKFQHVTVVEPPDLIEGELALTAQVIRQALRDLHSPVGDIRHEAMRFWRTRASVRFWEALLDLPEGVLHHEAQRRLEEI